MLGNKSFVPALLAGLVITGCGGGNSSNTPIQPAPTPNALPQISISNATAEEQTTVILSAQVSDSDGSIASYQWQQTAGTSVEIIGADSATAEFTAPLVLLADGPQTLSFSLTATDNDGGQTTETVEVTVNPVNTAPTAVIAEVADGKSFGFIETVLDGSVSSDTDGEVVSYQWQQISGEPLTVDSLEQAKLAFKAPNKAAAYEFQLTVTDNEGATSQTTVALENEAYFQKLAVGAKHQCALINDKDGNDVYCWGDNAYGQLNVPELSNPTEIISGFYNSCAIDENELKCWGASQQSAPALVNPVKVAMKDHACALDEQGVTCWGGNYAEYYGALSVPELTNPRDVAVGSNVSCALDDTGVLCWGNSRSAITNVPQITGVTQLFSGYKVVCGLHEQGLTCWGDKDHVADINSDMNIDPALIAGISSDNLATCVELTSGEIKCYSGYSNYLERIPTFDSPRMLSGGAEHSCTLDDSGVQCWGSYYVDQLNPPEMDNIAQIASGYFHLCVSGSNSAEESDVKCWGEVPGGLEVPMLKNVIGLSADDHTSCAITSEGPRCWGDETFYTESPSFFEPYSDQYDLPDWQNVSALEPGYETVCAIADGSVDCWGKRGWYGGLYGQYEIPTITNPTQLISGDTFICATGDEGLQCWGTNYGASFDVATPELQNVTSLSGEDVHACAISDGQVYCWGDSSRGNLNVPELSNPVKVAAGFENSCAIDDTGVVCWGSNSHGQLRVPELSNPTDIVIGHANICATGDTGIVCWGWQGFGGSPVPTREQAMAEITTQAKPSAQDIALLERKFERKPMFKKAVLGPVM